MKKLLFFFLLTCTLPLCAETLQEILGIYVTNATKEKNSLLIGFESPQVIPKKDKSLKRLVVFNQSLKELQKLKRLLKPNGLIIVLYMPKDSLHWKIVSTYCGEAFTDHLLETGEYRLGLKSLGMEILSESLYKGFAHYPSKEAIIHEFKEKPSIWGCEILNYTYLIPDDNNMRVGYRFIEFVLKS